MNVFASIFAFLPYIFSVILGWGERIFNSVGLSFIGWGIFAVGTCAVIKIFAPVIGGALKSEKYRNTQNNKKR